MAIPEGGWCVGRERIREHLEFGVSELMIKTQPFRGARIAANTLGCSNQHETGMCQ